MGARRGRARRSWRWAAGSALLAAVVALPACSDDDGAGEGAASSSTDPPTGEVCAWSVRADAQTLNIAYPDTASTYWAIGYDLAPGEVLELDGSFPDARYGSFTSYGAAGGAIDVVTDVELAPDEGSTNPFVAAADDSPTGTAPHDYTLIIAGAGDGEGPNVLAADPADRTVPEVTSTGSTTTADLSDLAADATGRLGSGELGDDGATSGTVLYRVYLPTDRQDPTGAVGLPDVTVVAADGTARPVPTCADPGPSAAAEELVARTGPATDRPAPDQPVFIRPGGEATNLFPNPDNTYLATIVEERPGQVVVVYGTAPTVPDQVRFWSICTNEYRKPYPVTACVPDADLVLDDEGRYLVVVSSEDDRPANATEDDGVTWLEWGTTEVDNLLLVRHLLADPDDPRSAALVPPGGLARETMGPLAPQGTYCEIATFEVGGLDACVAAAG